MDASRYFRNAGDLGFCNVGAERDDEDLIQKAVGWALREAGKTDTARLETYLRATGPMIPRTTLRYAIERFPPGKRQQLLLATRPLRLENRKDGS